MSRLRTRTLLPHGIIPFDDVRDAVVKRKLMLMNENMLALDAKIRSLGERSLTASSGGGDTPVPGSGTWAPFNLAYLQEPIVRNPIYYNQYGYIRTAAIHVLSDERLSMVTHQGSYYDRNTNGILIWGFSQGNEFTVSGMKASADEMKFPLQDGNGADVRCRDAVFCGDDGKRIAACCTNSANVETYTTDVAYSFSGIEHDGTKTLAAAYYGTFAFSKDGGRLYVRNQSNFEIRQYTLSEAWNVGSASNEIVLDLRNVFTEMYAEQSYLYGSGFCMSPDGKSMVVVVNKTRMSAQGNLYTYALRINFSTAWDLSSAVRGSYGYLSYFQSANVQYIMGIAVNNNGTKMLACDSQGKWYEWDLLTSEPE